MKNTSGNILSDFLEDIYSGGTARSTVEAYQKDVEYFSKWYIHTTRKEAHLGDINSVDLREYGI